jgi:hypothetical protein
LIKSIDWINDDRDHIVSGETVKGVAIPCQA